MFSQAEKALDLLLTKYLKAGISYEGIQRVEEFPFPKEALREALLNSVIHKDYSSGIPIQISVYDNKIYFWNDGHLPDSWTIEKLLEKHPSKPYNPLIANAFFRAGLIESWGRGIEKIHGECKKHGIPSPSFEYEDTGLMLLFKAKLSEESGTREKTREKILRLMKENPQITTHELAQDLEMTDKGVEYHIKKLKDDEKIDREGGDKGGAWKIL